MPRLRKRGKAGAADAARIAPPLHSRTTGLFWIYNPRIKYYYYCKAAFYVLVFGLSAPQKGTIYAR